MDLTKYTEVKKEESEIVLVDNNEVKITKVNDNIKFLIKKKEALKKYQDLMFFSPTNAIVTGDEKTAEDFFRLALDEGTEGLMFKNLNATYKPGVRTGAMAKLKETKEDIDVVIIGAEHGKGKRAGFYSSFIVAVKNENFLDDSDMYLQIGKVGSGLKELGNEGASMEKLTSLLTPLKVSEDDNVIWFEPKIILQVRYQEIQKSTLYNSGYALRFPRIISLREDKSLDEINSIDDIKNFIS